MNAVLVILAVLSAIAIVLVAAVVPKKPPLSAFELQRRLKQGLASAQLDSIRARVADEVKRLQLGLVGILLIILTVCFTITSGWPSALSLAFIVLILHGRVARLNDVHNFAQSFYNTHENKIIETVRKYQKVIHWLRSPQPRLAAVKLHSKAELEHLVEVSNGVVSNDEKQTVLRSLSFYQQLVSEHMTPIANVDLVKKTEMLGPLLLDELHKTGHSHFPVMHSDANHIVGIIRLKDILKVDTTKKHTATAETAMDKNVYYIHADQPLAEALTAFTNNHHSLAIVIDSSEATVGILSLQDTLSLLVGSSSESHDSAEDRREVASYRR